MGLDAASSLHLHISKLTGRLRSMPEEYNGLHPNLGITPSLESYLGLPSSLFKSYKWGQQVLVSA